MAHSGKERSMAEGDMGSGQGKEEGGEGGDKEQLEAAVSSSACFFLEGSCTHSYFFPFFGGIRKGLRIQHSIIFLRSHFISPFSFGDCLYGRRHVVLFLALWAGS